MFIFKLKKCINIYDIMITCYEQIMNYNISTHISNYDPRKYGILAGFVFQYVEESETSKLNAIKNLIQNIESAYHKKKFEFNEYFCIIKNIDARCEYTRYEMLQGEVAKYHGINKIKNVVSNVFPVIKETIFNTYDRCLIEYENNSGRKGKGLRQNQKQNNGNINDYLNNYIILNDEPYKVTLHCMNEHFSFFAEYFNEYTITAKTIPVLNEGTEKIFEISENGNSIDVKGVKEEYSSRIKETYKNALTKNNDCDIIVFPELFFTGINLDEIRDLVGKGEYENDKLFILGSCCEAGNNKSIVITSNGTVLFEQHKKTAYEKDGKFENLSYSDNIINIIDVNGVGRICVIVCKDILNDDIRKYIKILRVDMVFVVSYTPSLDMKSASEELAKMCHCISIISNSCSAVKGEAKKVGYITIPVKQDSYSNYHTEFYTNKECESCDMCKGHRISMKFDEMKLYGDNKIGIKICKTIEK